MQSNYPLQGALLLKSLMDAFQIRSCISNVEQLNSEAMDEEDVGKD